MSLTVKATFSDGSEELIEATHVIATPNGDGTFEVEAYESTDDSVGVEVTEAGTVTVLNSESAVIGTYTTAPKPPAPALATAAAAAAPIA